MDKETIIITMIIFIILILPIICIFYMMSCDYEIIEIQVKEKYVIGKGRYENYMIVDINNTTYEISNFIGDKTGDEIYNEIEIGKKYEIEKRGKRIPKLDLYKTIYGIKEIKEVINNYDMGLY